MWSILREPPIGGKNAELDKGALIISQQGIMLKGFGCCIVSRVMKLFVPNTNPISLLSFVQRSSREANHEAGTTNCPDAPSESVHDALQIYANHMLH